MNGLLRLVGGLLLMCGLSGRAIADNGQTTGDLLIENALIVTMDPERRVLHGGSVLIKDGSIAAIAEAGQGAHLSAARRVDAGGNLLMPGMISLHNHTAMVAFRGIGEYEVEDVLFEVMFPLERDLLTRHHIRVSARHAAIELALGGVTLVTDMYYHEDEVAHATAAVGIRGVLGETVMGFPVVDAPEPYGGLEYAERFIQDWQGHRLIIPAVAPHAPYTVEPEILRKSKALAEKYDVPMLMHMAEFPHELTLIQERFGTLEPGESSVAYLHRIGALSDKLLGAHMIYVDADDRALLKRFDVGISHNPKANIKGGQGIAPALEMVREGLAVGLGTDGPMSSNQMDILGVMPYLPRVARLRYDEPKAFSPMQVVEMATLGGARALDLEDRLGSLEVGKAADMVLLDLSAPNMQPLYDPYAVIVHSAYAGNVLMTVVDGAVVVDGGAIQTIDMAQHQVEWQAVTERVRTYRDTKLTIRPAHPQ